MNRLILINITTIRFIAGLILLLIISCENREWDNPFDPDCPKELFTPSNLKAEQGSGDVKLTWNQNNSQISGFTLDRSLDGTQWSTVANLDKNKNEWVDYDITGGTLYYYRIRAVAASNESNELITQIQPLFLSSVVTGYIFCHNLDSIAGNGEVTNDGGETIIARGLCWSSSPNPTIQGSKTNEGGGTGDFQSFITGLVNNTTYYIRAYSTNNSGTSYGEEITFHYALNVPGPQVTDVDGNVYNSVKIGTQIWMAENLKTTKYRDGASIPFVTDPAIWKNLDSGAFCYFTNSSSIGATYGGLYNFFAVTDTRGLCPEGWHVPTGEEWRILRDYLGGKSIAGGKLKETGTAHWNSPNKGASNITGFTATAGSWRGGDGNFYYSVGHVGWWWTSTSVNSTDAVFYFINHAGVGLDSRSNDPYFRKKAGCSVRCIKND